MGILQPRHKHKYISQIEILTHTNYNLYKSYSCPLTFSLIQFLLEYYTTTEHIFVYLKTKRFIRV